MSSALRKKLVLPALLIIPTGLYAGYLIAGFREKSKDVIDTKLDARKLQKLTSSQQIEILEMRKGDIQQRIVDLETKIWHLERRISSSPSSPVP